MASQGTIVAHLFTSDAMIPIEGATVTITQTNANGEPELLAVLLTNYDGFTDPVSIETPDFSDSQSYQQGSRPYAVVDLRVEHVNYGQISIQNVQVFADTQTLQEFLLIPNPAIPDGRDRSQLFVVPAQDL